MLLRYLGYILIISSVFRVVPIFAAIAYDEPILSFVISAIVSIILGLIFLRLDMNSRRNNSISFSQALILVTLSFVLLSLIGAISFLESFNYNLIDAVFESVSGLTTTGLSVYSTVQGVAKSLLLWRAMLQWIGGLGIVMFFLFLLSLKRQTPTKNIAEIEELSVSETFLYRAQGFSGATRLGVRISSAIKIYLVYTFAGIAMLFLTGMPFYDSVAMTFTSISTGGFTVSDAFYSDNLQLLVLSLLMLAGATSFIAHDRLFRGKIRDFLHHTERNILFAFIGVALLVAFVSSQNVRVVIFEVVSAYTTTGYTIASVASLPKLFILVIMVGMVIGGCTLSTAGGLKAFRSYVVLKGPFWYLRKLSNPVNAVTPFKVRNKPVKEKSLVMIQIFFSAWILLLLLGTFVLVAVGNNLLDASFQMTSALGTVGLSTMDLSVLHWAGKITLIFGMLLGRLELFPLLFFIRKLVKRSI